MFLPQPSPEWFTNLNVFHFLPYVNAVYQRTHTSSTFKSSIGYIHVNILLLLLSWLLRDYIYNPLDCSREEAKMKLLKHITCSQKLIFSKYSFQYNNKEGELFNSSFLLAHALHCLQVKKRLRCSTAIFSHHAVCPCIV